MKKSLFKIVSVILILIGIAVSLYLLSAPMGMRLSKTQKKEIEKNISNFFSNNTVVVNSHMIKVPSLFELESGETIYLWYNFDSSDVKEDIPSHEGDMYYENYKVELSDYSKTIKCKILFTYDTKFKEDNKYKEIEVKFLLPDNKNFEYNLYLKSNKFKIEDDDIITYFYEKEVDKSSTSRGGTITYNFKYDSNLKIVEYNIVRSITVYDYGTKDWQHYYTNNTVVIDCNEEKIYLSDYLCQEQTISLKGSSSQLEDAGTDYVKYINATLELLSYIDDAAQIANETKYISSFVDKGYKIEEILK